MGMDQYIYMSKNNYKSFGRWDEENGKSDITNYPEEIKVFSDYIFEHNFRSTLITEKYQIGYFRKFYALNDYIYNLVEYRDESSIYLDRDDVEELLNICKKVSEDHSKAEELLPTIDGDDYDKWYFEKLKEAIELFELILKEVDFDKWDISYEASW